MRAPFHARSAGGRQFTNYTPTFLADAMLGSLARKLRVFGYDTIYLSDVKDEVVLRIGITQNRVILTCDKELFRRIVKVGASGVLLECSSDLDSIVKILCKYSIKYIDCESMNSRCSACNGLLVEKASSDITTQVPPRILKMHKYFLNCSDCNKIYWQGKQFMQIKALIKDVNYKIKKEDRGNNSKDLVEKINMQAKRLSF